MPNKIQELETFLREKFALLKGSTESFEIVPFIQDEEANYFMQGLEVGLFTIDEECYMQSELLPPPRAKSQKQKSIRLFWHHGNGIYRLFREGICQIAAATRLVQKYGWPVNQVRLEPYKEDIGPVNYGVDLVVRKMVGGTTIICGEVKRNEQELNKLLSDLEKCSQGAKDGRPVNYRKFEACWHLKPEYFWVVCPTLSRTFALSYDNGTMAMQEVEDIPCWSDLHI